MRNRSFQIVLFLIYITVMTGIMIWQGIGIAPDRYTFLLLLPALLLRRTRSFLLDWIPFVFILLSYDFLRGFAPLVNSHVHYTFPIVMDRFLFLGQTPTQLLQAKFFHSGHLAWYDYLATIFYFLHFATPEAFAFILWMKNRKLFHEFALGLVLVSYAGWITYIIYPSAPPWLAHNMGYLPNVTKILDQTLQTFPAKLNLPTIYTEFNANDVAAIPSEHAAYPTMIFLFSYSFFKKKALFLLPYVFGVWISVIYLGEHYATDVIIGAVYAIVCFAVAKGVLNSIKFHSIFKRFLSFKKTKSIKVAER